MHILAEIPFFFSHIFPWPFIYAGGIFMFRALRDSLRALDSLRWTTVQGRVTRSDIGVTDTGGDYPHDLFSPIIEYTYIVGGQSRKSSKIAMADFNPGGRERAEQLLKPYRVGASVTVHVSPNNPDISLLEPGLRWPLLGRFLGGLFLFSAGVTCLVLLGGARFITTRLFGM